MIVSVFVGQDEKPAHVVTCDSFDVRAGVLYFYQGQDELPFMCSKLWGHFMVADLPVMER